MCAANVVVDDVSRVLYVSAQSKHVCLQCWYECVVIHHHHHHHHHHYHHHHHLYYIFTQHQVFTCADFHVVRSLHTANNKHNRIFTKLTRWVYYKFTKSEVTRSRRNWPTQYQSWTIWTKVARLGPAPSSERPVDHRVLSSTSYHAQIPVTISYWRPLPMFDA